MIDVEKLQKISNLAVELKNRGFATDMLDATAQAEGMINPGNEISQMQKDVVLDQAKRYSEDYANVNAQIRSLINHAREQQKTIEELNKKMDQIKFQFDTVKKESMQTRPVQQETFVQRAPAIQETVQQRVETVQQFVPQTSQAPYGRVPTVQNHARVGNYNPEDVAVDKIFYSGSR